MRSNHLGTSYMLEEQLQQEVFQCEELLALKEDMLLADLRYYEQGVHRQELPPELGRLYRRHICHIEMLISGLADYLVGSSCSTPITLH